MRSFSVRTALDFIHNTPTRKRSHQAQDTISPHCGRFSHRTALDFTAVRSFPPAVRKRSAVDLDRTGAAQCASPSNRAPPSCLETPS